jgi:hypothetical protein
VSDAGRLKRVVRTVAWVSIIGSFPVWTAAFAVAPFLPLPGEQRAAVGEGCSRQVRRCSGSPGWCSAPR